jgi:starch phosphorylase
MKSSSELGIPLVGIGLCYKEGYFQQYLSNDGWQQERYEVTDFYNQPMSLVTDEKNEAIKVELNFPGRKVFFQIWELKVGRVPLYLLDTNISENLEEDKKITRSLYGGNIETRIQQEIVLGIGGIRALHAMGLKPLVCHMNEGHSAFLALERIRYLIKNYGLNFDESLSVGTFSNVFTTHTPVPAGIDVFPNDLVEKYFGQYYKEELKISGKEFYKLGTIIKDREPANFNMAHLAMNMAGFVNGVSKLHGQVSRKIWVNGFKDIPSNEIPIDYITNGVHTSTHLSNEMNELLVRYLGDNYLQPPADKDIWQRIEDIPDEELWRTHERRRERLVAFARKRLGMQIAARGGSINDINRAKEVLDASALTIGFARRFATYKRATLLLRDTERLASILCNPDYPIQIIVAGKAHPRDEEGKKLIQDIVALAKDEALRKKVVFLENYDMNIARYMVEGCDVWLNNPRRPLEASGTSGMKVIANGGLNFSILDGWWDEAYDPEVGWAIGRAEEYDDLDYQDELESRLIYEMLEKEIGNVFYERTSDNLPRKWIKMMKSSMRKLTPFFNTNRMVEEYFTNYYNKAYEKRKLLMRNNWKLAKDFTVWKKHVMANWDKLNFIDIKQKNKNDDLSIGEIYQVNVEVYLGDLTHKDVEVQIYYGILDEKDLVETNKFVNMVYIRKKDNNFLYKGAIPCDKTGQFGYTLRIIPKYDLLTNPFELRLIKWA